MEKSILVRATWDSEASVWVAESDDVPGLATEAESLDALLLKLNVMIPELLEMNDGDFGADVPIELLARQGRPASARF
jgi:predicted RNase H-like HicB family nuclease